MITYANEGVVNWLTTLADMFRVAVDMGHLRAQFLLFHRPLFGWKGSYVVARAGVEQKVTYDHGMSGSIAEDTFFAMIAYRDGYKFSFIHGEMWEKSPFSVWDFLLQRKRWIQGIFLVVHSGEIPWRKKAWLALSLYVWITLPVSTTTVVLAYVFPIPCPQIFDILVAFIAASSSYMYIFGVLKSFSLHRAGVVKFLALFVGALCTIPFNITMENAAAVWGLLGNKYNFYVVSKEIKPFVVV